MVDLIFTTRSVLLQVNYKLLTQDWKPQQRHLAAGMFTTLHCTQLWRYKGTFSLMVMLEVNKNCVYFYFYIFWFEISHFNMYMLILHSAFPLFMFFNNYAKHLGWPLCIKCALQIESPSLWGILSANLGFKANGNCGTVNMSKANYM